MQKIRGSLLLGRVMVPYEEQAVERRLREFDFSDEDFDALRALVKSHIGIHLSEQKRELVYGRVSRRLRTLGLRDFSEYRELLSDEGSGELVAFCNAITTNLTAFFREAHHFNFLRQELLARTTDARAARRLRFWCAGCSTGEEPYSLAITICEAIGDLRRWDVRILATDVDTDVLDRAQRGIYGEERMRGMDPRLRGKYFRAITQATGAKQYAVSEDLGNLVCFRPLNLIHALPMKGPLDAVFCRNVVIYFEKSTQRDLFGRISKLQQPGGLLFVGHSESLFRVCEAYALVGKTIYRRC